MISQIMGLLPSQIDQISASDYLRLRRAYESRSLLPQRSDFFISQVAAVVAQVFSEKTKHSPDDFNPYLKNIQNEEETEEQLVQKLRFYGGSGHNKKVFSSEQYEQLMRINDMNKGEV